MNRKNQNAVRTTMPAVKREQVLLRDTGKTLKLKTGLKAGGIKGDNN